MWRGVMARTPGTLGLRTREGASAARSSEEMSVSTAEADVVRVASGWRPGELAREEGALLDAALARAASLGESSNRSGKGCRDKARLAGVLGTKGANRRGLGASEASGASGTGGGSGRGGEGESLSDAGSARGGPKERDLMRGLGVLEATGAGLGLRWARRAAAAVGCTWGLWLRAGRGERCERGKRPDARASDMAGLGSSRAGTAGRTGVVGDGDSGSGSGGDSGM